MQKLVKNDHVMALVKLKEEKLEREEQEKLRKNATSDISTEHTDNETMDDIDMIPKMTRAKAKALNKYPFPLAPITHSESDSEVVALIREELHSDDDDEEYQPGEDEDVS